MKAFPGESSVTVDKMILDQLIYGCGEEKVRMHLIEKAPSMSREALSLVVAYHAAIKYNESLRDSSSSITAMYSERGTAGYNGSIQWISEFSQNNRNFNLERNSGVGYKNGK